MALLLPVLAMTTATATRSTHPAEMTTARRVATFVVWYSLVLIDLLTAPIAVIYLLTVNPMQCHMASCA